MISVGLPVGCRRGNAKRMQQSDPVPLCADPLGISNCVNFSDR